jgi:ribulose-phosphate 3-epimerase
VQVDICPTIDAEDLDAYQKQMERIVAFTHRVHIDLADGIFTPNKLVPIDQVWWPGGVRADLHVMYKRPFDHLDALVALGPQLIIVQAEAEGDFPVFVNHVHKHGIEAGIALLQDTPVETILPSLPVIDHVLVFSGNLGHQGGSQADLSLLKKVKVIKEKRPGIEISWDGGVNDKNIQQLVAGGVEVINVGGFIQHAEDPHKAYESLVGALNPS